MENQLERQRLINEIRKIRPKFSGKGGDIEALKNFLHLVKQLQPILEVSKN